MPGPWGAAITKLRVAKGLTKESVAKRAGMTPTTYGRIERGQHTQTRKLQDIADVFAVDISAVLSPQSEPAIEAHWRQVRDTALVVRELESGRTGLPALPPALAQKVKELGQATEEAERERARERTHQEIVKDRIRPKIGKKK